MAIEFRSDCNKLHVIDNGIRLAHIDLFHKNLPMIVQYVPLDINVLEQILSKMKELQVEKQAYEDNLPDDYEVN